MKTRFFASVALFLILLLSLPAFAVTHSCTLTWKAPTSGPAPDHYAVYRSTTNGSGYVLLGVVASTQLSYVNSVNPDGTPLVEGVTYYYVVKSRVSTAESLPSNQVSGTIPITTTAVQAPRNLAISVH